MNMDKSKDVNYYTRPGIITYLGQSHFREGLKAWSGPKTKLWVAIHKYPGIPLITRLCQFKLYIMPNHTNKIHGMAGPTLSRQQYCAARMSIFESSRKERSRKDWERGKSTFCKICLMQNVNNSEQTVFWMQSLVKAMWIFEIFMCCLVLASHLMPALI